MESAIVDALFDFVAAICAMLLLYGGWLALRYSRGVDAGKSHTEMMPTEGDRRSPVREPGFSPASMQ